MASSGARAKYLVGWVEWFKLVFYPKFGQYTNENYDDTRY